MRKTEISYMNILLCLLVMFVHVSSYPMEAYEVGTVAYSVFTILWRLSTFVVQGFVFLSGLRMFIGKKQRSYPSLLMNKIMNILVPYLVWFFVYFLYYAEGTTYPIESDFLSKHLYWGSLMVHLYFVVLIMQFFVLAPLWKLMVTKCRAYIMIPIALAITLFCDSYLPDILSALYPDTTIYNDRFFTTYLVYWVMGCYAGHNYETFKSLLIKYGKWILMAFISITAINSVLAYINYNNIATVPFMNTAHSIYCVITILFVFYVTMKIPTSFITRIPLLVDIDRSSYTIYLCHMLYVFASDYIVIDVWCIFSRILAFFARMVLVYTLSITTGIAIYRFKSAVKTLPDILKKNSISQ